MRALCRKDLTLHASHRGVSIPQAYTLNVLERRCFHFRLACTDTALEENKSPENFSPRQMGTGKRNRESPPSRADMRFPSFKSSHKLISNFKKVLTRTEPRGNNDQILPRAPGDASSKASTRLPASHVSRPLERRPRVNTPARGCNHLQMSGCEIGHLRKAKLRAR